MQAVQETVPVAGIDFNLAAFQSVYEASQPTGVSPFHRRQPGLPAYICLMLELGCSISMRWWQMCAREDGQFRSLSTSRAASRGNGRALQIHREIYGCSLVTNALQGFSPE
jgi:hypothetical protein